MSTFITSQPVFNPFKGTSIVIEDKFTPITNNSVNSVFSTFDTNTNPFFVVEDKFTPIIPGKKTVFYSNTNSYNTLNNPYSNVSLLPVGSKNSLVYYDSIGDNPIARHSINEDLRYKFLDKWLYANSSILKMLKVDNGSVRVLSRIESEKNDISKDSETDLLKKSDYIGDKVLSLSKNGKVLDAICRKNNLRYYDLPHNERYVRREQEKYVKRKLEKMQK